MRCAKYSLSDPRFLSERADRKVFLVFSLRERYTKGKILPRGTARHKEAAFMRRSDREIKDRNEIRSIIDRCKVIRLAMLDEDGFPYIIPLNFGVEHTEDGETIYCHCAREGRKLELLRRDARVAFEMDCGGELVRGETACSHSYYYASVIGSGRAEFLEGTEKARGLSALMRHMAGREDHFTEEQMAGVVVFAIRVETLSAKAKKRLTAQS